MGAGLCEKPFRKPFDGRARWHQQRPANRVGIAWLAGQHVINYRIESPRCRKHCSKAALVAPQQHKAAAERQRGYKPYRPFRFNLIDNPYKSAHL